MKDSATLKELLAIVIRKGKTILVLALVVALLLGGFQAFKLIQKSQDVAYTQENIDARYESAMTVYEASHTKLQKQLETAQRNMATQQEYIDNSIWMSLDPYDVRLTTIHFAITDIEESNETHEVGTIPVEYMTEKIQNQYVTYWNSLDLNTALTQSHYANTTDKYLREVLILNLMPGGGLSLLSLASDDETSLAMAQAAYACLSQGHAAVAEASYSHTFSLLSQTTKSYINESINKARENCDTNIETFATAVADAKEQLAALKKPVKDVAPTAGTIAGSGIKWAIIGLCLGLVIGAIWAILNYLFRGRVETSRDLEEGLGINFLGNANTGKDVFQRLANRIIHERSWSSALDATDYICQNLAYVLDNQEQVVLLSSLKDAEKSQSVEVILAMIAESGCRAVLVSDATHNPKAIEQIRQADKVILAEAMGISRWSDVSDLVVTVKKQEKSVCGFIAI